MELSPSSRYLPPVQDIVDALEVAGLGEVLQLEAFAGIDASDVALALGQFGRLASEVIAPTDRSGDLLGAQFVPESKAVVTPEALHGAYREYVRGGWGALQFPERYGGSDFPAVVGLALQEMFASANLALSLNPVLTQSGIKLLLTWGSEEQRERYLPKMLTGEWSGTMALTEPEAGSDLGALSTRAERGSDGRWRITGTKIFTTWGEHDLADNIIHLLLARSPGGPPGSRGVSTFIVPKFLPGENGEASVANSLSCARLEEKLGIHASPTCEMHFDGAFGELVGSEHNGLHEMLTMMNSARLSVGLEGAAIGERAYQQALGYARERRQGRANGADGAERSLLIEHPDVRRMLLDMRTRVLAARLLIYRAGAYGDLARHHRDRAARTAAQAMVDLLTPIAKAWATDSGLAIASLGIQVLGGAGYLEEQGMAQRFRDARIAPIYEGTNGIQAIDLVSRKIGRDRGRWTHLLLDEIEGSVSRTPQGDDPLGLSRVVLAEAHEVFRAATTWMLGRLESDPDETLAGATNYLELAGITIGGWLMLRRAEAALARGDEGAAVGESNFFASETTARASGLLRPITSGAGRLSTLD